MMGTERLIAALNLLAEQSEHEPEDLHEVHFKVVAVPDDLLKFERELTQQVEQKQK
jgi:hypothetical protein